MSMTAICELNDVERHAVARYYEKCGDINEAIEMAKYSPSACNRQYIKVHYLLS